MSSSLLQALPKTTDGLLLFESFENINFPEQEGWTLLNGVPSISQDVAKQGLSSLKLDTTYCKLEKSFSPAFGASAVWFYDDASVVAGGFQPFITWTTSSPAEYGLGVDTAVSAGFYTVIINGVKSATTIPRTTAFHRFSIARGNFGSVTISVDNVPVYSAVIFGQFVTVRVGCYVYSGTPAFGYFDWVQVTNAQFYVSGVSNEDLVELYADTGLGLGTLIASAPAFGDSVSMYVPDVDSPFNGHLVVRRPDTRLRAYGATRSLSVGDAMHLIEVNLGRKPSSVDVKDTVVRDDKESNSGKNQSMAFNARERFTLSFRELTDELKDQLYAWWAVAKKGEVVGVVLNSDNRYYDALTAKAVASSLSLYPNAVAGLGRGSELLLRSSDGLDSQIVVAQDLSVGPPLISLKSGLALNFDSEAPLRSKFYWPFAITTDKALNLSLSNLKAKRWNLTVAFKENL